MFMTDVHLTTFLKFLNYLSLGKYPISPLSSRRKFHHVRTAFPPCARACAVLRNYRASNERAASGEEICLLANGAACARPRSEGHLSLSPLSSSLPLGPFGCLRIKPIAIAPPSSFLRTQNWPAVKRLLARGSLSSGN